MKRVVGDRKIITMIKTLPNSDLRELYSKEAEEHRKDRIDYRRWKRSMSRIKKIMRIFRDIS